MKLDEVVSAHGGYLLSLARRWCPSGLDPDDLFQDLLLKAMCSPVPADANPRAWLTRVMKNLMIDKLRRARGRREELVAEPVAPAASEPPSWWEELGVDAVRAELANVPADQRITFELFALEGKSYEEIASTLGIAKATVGTRILRARKRLRSLLDGYQPQL